MKKTLAILLVLVLALAICAPAMAAKLTIKNAETKTTYAAYKMLGLEVGTDSYKYSITNDWKDFFATGEGNKYLTGVQPDNNVVPVMVMTGENNEELQYLTISESNVSDLNVRKFAAEARSAAATVTPTATATATAADSKATAVFEKLDNGYYLVLVLNADNTINTARNPIILNVTKDVETAEKNAYPWLEKKVQVGENSWEKANTANIGETVTFKVSMKLSAAGMNYVLHDAMPGFTFGEIISVTIGGPDEAAKDSYKVTVEQSDGGCTFEVSFNDPESGWVEGTEIVVTYTAALNNNAVIAGDGNVNSATLKHTNKHSNSVGDPVYDTTTTSTYQFDLVKKDSANKLLDGAKFKLYDAATGDNEIHLVKTDNGYRPALANETPADSIVVENGKVLVYGLVGTYYLEETQAPAGYNKLTSRVEVKIEAANPNLTATIDKGENASTWTGGGVHVTNLTGSELPSTGGIGTTIFYVVGGLLMAVAVVLLVTKKKTSRNK